MGVNTYAQSGSEKICGNWPVGATGHACMVCAPEEIARLNHEAMHAGMAQEAKVRQAQAEMVRDGRLFGVAAGTYSPRTFTRAEVLAVLNTFRAIAPAVDPSGEREKAAVDIAAIFGGR